MKFTLILFLLFAFTSCGNGSNTSTGSDTAIVPADTSLSGKIITDSAGAGEMNADTTGMSRAK